MSRRLSSRRPHQEKWTLPAGRSVSETIKALVADPAVAYAEPDYLVQPYFVSDDPVYTSGSLWGMQGDGTSPGNPYGSQAGEAWAAGHTGSPDILVGVVDEGIEYLHPDLADNVWTNPFDPVDGIDNDGNGYVDDVHGWDFFNDDATVYDGTGDDHATHVAGTIGGRGGNGIGVAGVNWNVTMISAKFLGPNGGYVSDAVRALDYLTDLKVRHGLNIVGSSNSWGGGGFSQTLLDAINDGGDAGVLFVAAAGNSASNNDATANYPSSYECTNGGTRGWDCVVAVASITSTGGLSGFSSHGATRVDLGAPGSSVVSTVPSGAYASDSGTSMAAAHVSGAVALCAAINPALSAREIRQAVLSSATATASLQGKTVTGGRLNVGDMVLPCLPATGPVGVPTGLSVEPTSPTTIALDWTDGVEHETSYEIQRAPDACSTSSAFATVGFAAGNATTYTSGGLQPSTTYCYRVRGINGFNGGAQSDWSNSAGAATLGAPQPYVSEPAPYAWIDPTAGGTLLPLADDSSATVVLPFPFPFYGTPTTAISVSSNGFITFTGAPAVQYDNVGIPSSAEPNGIVAAFWDDLDPGAGGGVWTRTVGSAPARQFVIGWVGVPHSNVAGSALSAAIVLDEQTGSITLQYLDTVLGDAAYDHGASATAGIEDAQGDSGTLFSMNSASVFDGTAHRFSQGVAVAPTITSVSLPDGTTGAQYASALAAAGGTTPYTWSIASGALPAGLVLDSDTGLISGTLSPSAVTSTFGVSVAGVDGLRSTTTLTLRVAAPLQITAASLPGGAVGTAYSHTIVATGGTAPYTWSVVAGAPPPGLSLDSATGVLAGTPTSAGTVGFTAQVVDAGSPRRTAQQAMSMTIVSTPPGAFSKVAPASNARALPTSVQFSWAASANATSYEYCYDTSNNQACDGRWIAGTALQASITGLTRNKTYYWQVRALNGSGTTLANGGAWWKFQTGR